MKPRRWPHAVTIEPFIAYDENGVGQYGPGVAADALIVIEHRRTRNAEGEEVLGSATLYIQNNVSVGRNDRITTPNGLLPVAVLDHLLEVSTYYDLDGAQRATRVVV